MKNLKETRINQTLGVRPSENMFNWITMIRIENFEQQYQVDFPNLCWPLWPQPSSADCCVPPTSADLCRPLRLWLTSTNFSQAYWPYDKLFPWHPFTPTYQWGLNSTIFCLCKPPYLFTNPNLRWSTVNICLRMSNSNNFLTPPTFAIFYLPLPTSAKLYRLQQNFVEKDQSLCDLCQPSELLIDLKKNSAVTQT